MLTAPRKLGRPAPKALEDVEAGRDEALAPFDRLIVSATRSVRGTLITRDGALADSGLVETLWA